MIDYDIPSAAKTQEQVATMADFQSSLNNEMLPPRQMGNMPVDSPARSGGDSLNGEQQ